MKKVKTKLTAVIAALALQYTAYSQMQFAKITTHKNLTTAPVSYSLENQVSERRYDGKFIRGRVLQSFDSLKLGNIPVQISFTPGLSTRGRQSKTTVNAFSLNILGGQTGGVNGFELGGLFNLNTGPIRSLQIAGLFNLTSGYVKGLQIAGLYNGVRQSVHGVQIAGLHNMVSSHVTGLQISGIYNHAAQVKGLQIAGIGNYSRNQVKGIQVAGIANISKRVDGIQVAGIVNRTKRLRGIQVGLINIADTSDGYSIGLINVVPKGYHKLAFTTNEVMHVNAALKTGTKKLYSMIVAGANARSYEKIYSFGAGLGKQIDLNNFLSVNPEFSSQYVYMGTFSKFNLLSKFLLDVHINIGRHLSIFGGPSFSTWYKEQPVPVPGYKNTLPPAGYNTFRVSQNVDGWIGWNAGISFF